MLTFLALSSLVAFVCLMVGIGLLVGAIIWAVLLPIRLMCTLIFGLAGAFFGVLLVPILLTVVAVVAAVALVAAVIAALVPLLPVLAVALIGWAIYKAVTRRPSPAL